MQTMQEKSIPGVLLVGWWSKWVLEQFLASRLQPVVTLSTTEAEYISATAAAQEILWLRNLFKEIGYEVEGASSLYLDNQSAIAVSRNPEHHGRMKHLDLRHYWLRDTVKSGVVDVKYC